MRLSTLLATVTSAAAGAALALILVATPSLATDVSDKKKTTLGLYMTAVEAGKIVQDEASKVLFVDVRTPAEVMFVGVPTLIDVNVPFVDLKNPVEWDEKNNRFTLAPNAAFVAEVEKRLAAKNLTKDSQVIVMCRSGDRSGKAVDALAQAGFKNAWTVLDGFEGDLSKDGRRDVNGWRLAGLPWTYTLDKAKMTVSGQ